MSPLLRLTEQEKMALIPLLTHRYDGVFDDRQVASHIANHVQETFAEYATELVGQVLSKEDRLLDVGSGFGSFVTLLRLLDYESYGIELDEGDVHFARSRYQKLHLASDSSTVFRIGDFITESFEPLSFRVITMWNVAEHVPSVYDLLKKAHDLLTSPGFIFLVCPNYAASRQEAHYHIPWHPELLTDEKKLRAHIRGYGKNPAFFFENVWARTNVEVCSAARKVGFRIAPLYKAGRSEFRLPRPVSRFRQPLQHRRLSAPSKHSVELLLVKGA